MNFAAYQWRADAGYLPPAGSVAAVVAPQFRMPALIGQAPSLQLVNGPVGVYGMIPHQYASVPQLYPVAMSPARPNPYAPPELRPGMNYMFADKHTNLHIFRKASRIWESKYHGGQFDFKQFLVPVSLTVQDVINKVINAGDDEDKGKKWAVTEVFEAGSGVWHKGSTTTFTSDKSKKSLVSVGWDERRGRALPPVWLVVHTI